MEWFVCLGIRVIACVVGVCILSTDALSYYWRNLRTIPSDIPPDTMTLTIAWDSIPNITSNAFATLAVLTSLEVSQSGVMYIHEGAFYGLDALTDLILYSNNIRNLPELDDISDTLVTLDLKNNPLSLENINTRLASMAVLEVLTMDNCGLTGTLSLPVLRSLQKLYVKNNEISRLAEDFFTSLGNLELFDLQNNQLQHIDLSFPASLSNLNYYDNEITVVTREKLRTLTGVSALSLGKNQISSLEDGTFADLAVLTDLRLRLLDLTMVPDLAGVADTLTTLHLDNTKITLRNTDNLSGLERLRTLIMHHCQLAGELTLPTFPQMINLDFSYNQLTRLSPGIFKGYEGLIKLYLQENHINVLGIPTDFPVTLKILDLSNNPITVIPTQAFAVANSTSALQQVLLNNCDIELVESGAFNGLDSATTVPLYYNDIPNLTEGNFHGLSAVITMELYGSGVTAIAVGAFNGMQALTSLDISWNDVTTLQTSTFRGLMGLTSLEVDNNELHTLEKGTFQELENLIRLDLDHNKLTTLVRDTFVGMVSLNDLYLESNVIQVIEDGAFNGLYALQELHIEQNSLVYFPEMTDLSGSLVRLYANNNPMTFLNASYLSNFNRLNILNVQSCSLRGDLELPPLPALGTLDASSNAFTGIKPALFRGFTNLNSVSLRQNRIVQMPLFADAVGPLDPASSEDDLTHVGFPRYFTLDLRYNQITDIPEESISQLTLGFVNLYSNPVDCGSMCWMLDCRVRKDYDFNVLFPLCYGQPWNGLSWSSPDVAYLCPLPHECVELYSTVPAACDEESLATPSSVISRLLTDSNLDTCEQAFSDSSVKHFRVKVTNPFFAGTPRILTVYVAGYDLGCSPVWGIHVAIVTACGGAATGCSPTMPCISKLETYLPNGMIRCRAQCRVGQVRWDYALIDAMRQPGAVIAYETWQICDITFAVG